MPNNKFSARFTRRLDFRPGVYRLHLSVDDGVRLYIDKRRVIDEWHVVPNRQEYHREMALSGKHDVRIEHFEGKGRAALIFVGERVEDVPSPPPSPPAAGT